MTVTPQEQLAETVRVEGARVLATLIRTLGSLQLAEDAVQDAVLRAFETWPRDGIPAEPRAWLTVTARRRAIDLIRRESRRSGKEAEAVALLEPVDAPLTIVVTHGIVSRVLRGLYARLPREAALILPVLQNRIFRMSNGAIEEIRVSLPDA